MKRILAITVLCASIGLLAAGCGGSDAQAPAENGNQQPSGQTGDAPSGAPGGSGKVTDVSGSTAQVEGQQSQVAVSWTDATTFTKEVAADAAAVKVGTCVMASSAQKSGDDSSSDSVAAVTVRVTPATDGSCTVQGTGGLPGRGTPPSGAPEGEQQGRPTDVPSNGGRGAGGFGGAIGEVTDVTDSGFVVASQRLGSEDSKTTSVTVTTSADTTYTTTEKASAADVKVGACVTSMGEADDTGAITAKTIAVSEPVGDECGFGGMRAGQPS